MIAITFNVALLAQCRRMCTWCYIEREMIQSKALIQQQSKESAGDVAQTISETIKQHIKDIKTTIKENGRKEEPILLYLSLPLNTDYELLDKICGMFMIYAEEAKLHFDKIYTISQPIVADNIYKRICKTCRMTTLTPVSRIICISSPSDVKYLEDHIVITKQDRLMLTALTDRGLRWEIASKDIPARIALIISEHPGTTIIESIFNKAKMEFGGTEGVRLHHLLSTEIAKTGIKHPPDVEVSSCTHCHIKENKNPSCFIKTNDILCIETAAKGIVVGCPYEKMA